MPRKPKETAIPIYCKVGSLPGVIYALVGDKLPEVGERFKIRTWNEKYAKPESVRVLEIKNVLGKLLFVCERF
jgi:hypothetical protein